MGLNIDWLTVFNWMQGYKDVSMGRYGAQCLQCISILLAFLHRQKWRRELGSV